MHFIIYTFCTFSKENGSGITNSTFTPIWVSWQDGLISAGKGITTGRQTLVSWQDQNRSEVKIVSLATSGGEGEWVIETPGKLNC